VKALRELDPDAADVAEERFGEAADGASDLRSETSYLAVASLESAVAGLAAGTTEAEKQDIAARIDGVRRRLSVVEQDSAWQRALLRPHSLPIPCPRCKVMLRYDRLRAEVVCGGCRMSWHGRPPIRREVVRSMPA